VGEQGSAGTEKGHIHDYDIPFTKNVHVRKGNQAILSNLHEFGMNNLILNCANMALNSVN
jgi:hypothetical protein